MRLGARIIVVVALLSLGLFIWQADSYQLFVVALVGLTAIVGVGLNVLLGLNGQISLGHVAFYAIGAYTVGILTTKLGWSFWLALPLAGALAGTAGALLAIPALRVRGPYLAMVTIAFGFVVEQSAAEWSGLTGGWNGLIGIAVPSAFGWEFSEREMAVFVIAMTAAALWLYARLAGSPWGMAMRAVRDSETAAQSIGLDPVLVRTTAFALSALAAGMAGGVFAAMSNFISPESFPFFQSILFLLVVMIGGVEAVVGPVLGAVIIVLLPEVLSSLAEYRLLFVGLLLLVVLRLAPGGLVGLASRFLDTRDIGDPPKPRTDVIAFLTSGSRAILAAEGLSISFGGVRAVRGLSFEAAPGRITSLIGPNGAGKSTALNLVCGFYSADEGSVRLGSEKIGTKSAHAIARVGVARTYQTTQLFGQMTVLDNVLIALRRGRLDAGAMLAPAADPHAEVLAESLLAFVGYPGRVRERADALPHVDKRLVEIARALATRPQVIALDEPAAGLNRQDTARLGALLRKLADAGIAVLLVEHDMQLVMSISDQVIVLDAGAKIAEGPPAAVARDPLVLKAYLGEQKSSERTRKAALPSDRQPLLSAHHLAAGYGSLEVIRDVRLDIEEGELVAVLGANGAGKSTLMQALSGLNRPVDGQVLFLGSRIETLAANRIAGQGLVLVPEGRQVFPELSVVDNLELGAYARVSKDIAPMIERLLDRFPRLRERRAQRAGLLSGGEQQQLAIARGLIARPRVLMLDEPSLGLAPMLVEQLFDLIAELRDEGTTILLVDQMAGLALSVADRVYILQSGEMRHAGTADDTRKDPALMAAYLGEL